MSASVNKAIILGTLGRDPDVKYMQDDRAVANVSIATSERWTDKHTGEKREVTEWHRVVFYGPLADVVERYLRKGSRVYVEGQIKTRKWQDKDTGQDRYVTEIQAREMKMLGGPRDQSQAPQRPAAPPTQAPTTTPTQAQVPLPPQSLADMDDDIPF